MKQLKFKHHLVKEILEGRKTVTWRLFDDKDLKGGDHIEFVDADSGNTFAKAEIVNVREKKLSDIEESDTEGHEKYGSTDETITLFKNYYGDNVTADTIVKIVGFTLLSHT